MKRVFTILLLSIILTTLATAGVSIDSKPKNIYNLGDDLPISITTNPVSDYGNLNIDLICENNSINLMKWSAISFGAQTNYQLPLKQITKQDLEIDSYNTILGRCQISARLGNEQDLTEIFTISKDINLEATTDKTSYNPGEIATISITATKANNDLLNGFLETSGLEILSKAVENGAVTETFKVSETKEAGNYPLNLFIYDKDANNEILNQANSSIEITINQIPSSIITSLSKIEVIPGEELDFGLDIYDQSGISMPGVIQTIILSPEAQEKTFSTNSGEINSATFETNATPGTYYITSTYEEMQDQKEFTVTQIQKVEFEFLDTILIIKNIGNTRYNKTIEINIGDEVRKLELDIKVGEERRFNLKAPEGEYDITVTDGLDTTKRTLLLTGSAISINDLKGLNIFTDYWLIWIFVIIILVLVVIVMLIKYRKKGKILSPKSIAQRVKSNASNTLHFTNKSPESQSLDLEKHQNAEQGIIDITAPEVNKAESALVLKGEKQNSAIIALKIKNNLTENSKQALASILNTATKKGMVEPKGDYIMIIFTPLVTKTFSNENLAAKTAGEIFKKLNTYNKKSVDKIQFNIALNSGDLITSLQDKKLKYTSIGNTILLAKKIADQGENQILVSGNLRTKLSRTLKAQKAGTIGNLPYYSVNRIVNTTENQEKLKDILKRMKR